MNHLKHRYVLTIFLTLYTCAQAHLITARQETPDRYNQLQKTAVAPKKIRPFTILIYMAADNDLRSFAARNIKQMAAIGSNNFINIAVHLDIRIANNKKITRRYYIEQNQILHVNAYDQATQQMDSGQAETLVSACKWAITDYPAENYVLVFWNHGTGALDPQQGRIINATELFNYNSESRLLELDRTTSILGSDACITRFQDPQNILRLLERNDPVELEQALEDDLQTDDPRGICWDDSTGNYLTNQKLDYALQTVRTNYLNNGKFAIIGFDACLMSMLEVGDLIKSHAEIMVGSQEVELGTGWNYQKVLEPFLTRNLSKYEFAKHIANVYEETYNKITNDYTQSAIVLDALQPLNNLVDAIATTLIEALRIQKNKSVYNAIHASKNKLLCTHFDEPSYIDLHHFLTNLEQNLKHFNFTNQARGKTLLVDLRNLITQTKGAINKAVIANVSGKNLAQAKGLSIYFPENRIHSSYAYIPFAQQNSWLKLLQMYVAG
jgi:hypothetical protein